jgi:hypothetical protein
MSSVKVVEQIQFEATIVAVGLHHAVQTVRRYCFNTYTAEAVRTWRGYAQCIE